MLRFPVPHSFRCGKSGKAEMDPRRRKKRKWGRGISYSYTYYVHVLRVYVRMKGERLGGNFDANDSNNDPRSSFVSVAALSFPDDGGEKKKGKEKRCCNFTGAYAGERGEGKFGFLCRLSLVLILSRGGRKRKANFVSRVTRETFSTHQFPHKKSSILENAAWKRGANRKISKPATVKKFIRLLGGRSRCLLPHSSIESSYGKSSPVGRRRRGEEEGDNNRALMDPAAWDGDGGGRHNAEEEEEEVSSFLLFVRSVGRPRIIKASPPSHKHTGRQPLPFSHLLMPRDSQKISSYFERGGGGGGETDADREVPS